MPRYTSLRLPDRAPRLRGRSPEVYAQELQEFLDAIYNKITGGIPAGFNETVPIVVLVGGTGSPGNASAGWMAADAQLVLITGAPAGLGNGNAEGSSSAAPRLDHVHKRDVRVFSGGAEIAIRNALNFIGFTVTDDPGNDRVSVQKVDDTPTIMADVMSKVSLGF